MLFRSEEGYLAPNKIVDGETVSKPRSEWSTNEFELAKWHHRAVNAIFGGVDMKFPLSSSAKYT